MGLRSVRGRGLAAWGFSLALIALSGYGISLARELNSDLKAKTASELAASLVELFETSTEELSRQWLADIADARDLEDFHKIELRLRDESELFDALYVWSKGETSGLFEYPSLQPTTEIDSHQLQNCLADSGTSSVVGLGLGTALSLGDCINASPHLRESAAVLSATYLMEENRAQEALEALDGALDPTSEGDHDPSSSLGADYVETHFDAHLLRAQALIHLDQPSQALGLLSELTLEIEAQNGADLLTLGPMLQAQVVPLIASIGDMTSIRAATQISSAIQRRLLGYRELTRRMDQDAPPSTSALATAYSVGGQLPFLIAYGEAEGLADIAGLDNGDAPDVRDGAVKDNANTYNAAVQMDLTELLNWFMILSATIDQTAHEYLVIIDNHDNVLAGASGDTEFIGEAQFRSMLPNLRLKINSQHQADNAELYKRQFVMQLLPIFVAALLGLMALIVRNKADRQDKKLRQRQTEFATRVTHELKTPLAGIRLMAENLEMGAVDDPEIARNFAIRIVEESDKLAARVEEILLIAKSTNVEATTPVDLFDLLAEVTDEWEPRFDDAGIELRVDMNESAVILGDPPILRDAISNLLDNAMKYRAPDVDSYVSVSLANVKREAVIKISDNGIGVPSNMQRVIFERFARVEGPQRGKAGGHGLGLSFTNETITSHHGSIECRSNASGGACFIVRLPVASRAVTDELLEG